MTDRTAYYATLAKCASTGAPLPAHVRLEAIAELSLLEDRLGCEIPSGQDTRPETGGTAPTLAQYAETLRRLIDRGPAKTLVAVLSVQAFFWLLEAS